MDLIRVKQQLPAKPKIITIALNPAVDYFIEVNGLSPGDNIVAESSNKFAAGKGFNVAKAVESLGGRVCALGFIGSQSLALFQGLKSEQLLTDFVVVDGETRSNITIFDTNTGTETHIRTAGFGVNVDDCSTLIEKLTSLVKCNDIVIISGSLPAGTTAKLYVTILDLCHRKSAISILDAHFDLFNPDVKAKPWLIKPNLAEFEQLVGKPMHDDHAVIVAARELIRSGVEAVVVSKAEQGALYIDRKQVFKAWVNGRDFGKTITNIGCGDAMVAGLAYAKLRGDNIRQILNTAVACGTANLFSVEPGKFDKRLYSLIYHQVRIETL